MFVVTNFVTDIDYVDVYKACQMSFNNLFIL
jgi:hypothetical protein